jgi:hypothetical protein
LREPNVVIGHTALDATRRAYLVDGGNFLQIPSGTSDRALAKMIYEGDASWVSKDDADRPGIKSRPLHHILEGALVESRTASWWTRLKVAFRRWRGADEARFTPDAP